MSKWAERAAAAQSGVTTVTGSKGKQYIVRQTAKGWTCTCPAFTVGQYRGMDCKHIKQVMDDNAKHTKTARYNKLHLERGAEDATNSTES